MVYYDGILTNLEGFGFCLRVNFAQLSYLKTVLGVDDTHLFLIPTPAEWEDLTTCEVTGLFV